LVTVRKRLNDRGRLSPNDLSGECVLQANLAVESPVMNSRVLTALMLVTVVTSSAVLAARQSTAAIRTFQARLSTVPIDLGMAANIAGTGGVAATLKGRTLSLTGTFKGLKTPATVARLHRSPNRGMRGASFADLTASAATSGEIGGSVELTDVQVEDLEKGRLYVQLHSEKAPDGNLWGWLLPK
jgi:hypothetical protein